MAQRRMFALSVVDTDVFLDMPASTQNLYFHLGMRADDDGFISNPRKITAFVNCSTDDLKLLIVKGLIIPFDSGVCVVRDWRVNNYIQKDRYRETRYIAEKRCLSIDESGAYNRLDTPCIQNVSSLDTQVRGRVSLELGEGKRVADKLPRATRFTPPTLEEVAAYVQERGSKVDPQGFIDFYSSKGWLVGKSPMRDWKAACRNADKWERWDKAPAADRNRLRTENDYQSSNDFFGGD